VDLNELIPLPIESENFWVIAAYYYCDESGRPNKDRYASFGGYIGRISDWNPLSLLWNKELRRFNIPAIHVSKMYLATESKEWGPIAARYGDRWPEVREEILNSFASLVNESEVKPIVVHVDAEEFWKMPNVRRVFENPYYLAFVYCMRKAISVLVWPPEGYAMGIVLDHNENTQRGCLELVSELRKREPQIARHIASLCFVKDEHFPGVQAADMVLHLTRRAMTEGMIRPSERIMKLVTPHYQPEVLGKVPLTVLEEECKTK
jgi:hypothetical protein